MELGEYLNVLRKYWFGILLIGLLGAGAAYAYASSLPATYRATSSLWVSVPVGESVGERVQGATYAHNLIESYAQLATKPFVLDPVIEELELAMTPRTLARSITVSRPVNSTILEVWATSGDPQEAADVANAVSAELSRAVGALEGDVAGDVPTVQLTVVASASTPPFPYGPNTRLYVATGLAGGLALGMILALMRTLADTRIRSAREARLVSDAAVLTNVRKDRRMAKDPLVVRHEPFGDQAEAYRRLRTNLRFLKFAGSSRSILVTSSIPGEGKTTTAINLALTMAEGSSRILLIDADLRKPSVARYLGLEGAVGLTTVLIGEATVDAVIQPWGGSIDVLPSGQIPPNPSELLDSEGMADLLRKLGERYDVILLDGAPLLPVTDSAALSRFVDGAVVVIGCQTVHRHQLAEALGSLAAVDARVLGLLLNRVPRKELGSPYIYGSSPRTRLWARARLGRGPRGEPGPAHAARSVASSRDVSAVSSGRVADPLPEPDPVERPIPDRTAGVEPSPVEQPPHEPSVHATEPVGPAASGIHSEKPASERWELPFPSGR